MKIVICSKNESKNKAVKEIIGMFITDYTLESLETDSKVSETPIGDDEGIKGCINRIEDALIQNSNANLYIAMEGILTKTNVGTFLCGWTVIYNKDLDEYYYGCSAKVKIPNVIINNLTKEERLSDVVAKYIGSTEKEVSRYGTNGMLTQGAYTRVDEFKDSVLCAISSNYKKLKD